MSGAVPPTASVLAGLDNMRKWQEEFAFGASGCCVAGWSGRQSELFGVVVAVASVVP